MQAVRCPPWKAAVQVASPIGVRFASPPFPSFPVPDASIPASDRRIDLSFLKRRGAALALTILIHLLMLLALFLTHGPQILRKKDDGLVTFSIMPEAEKKDAGEKKKTESRSAEKAAAPAQKQAEAPPPPVATKPTETPPSFIQLSPGDFASADIGKLPSHGAANGDGGSTGNSKAVAGPGEGPGGVQLYEAEWYRRPTNAELDTYMPANPPREGWGLVACRTIENFHVENCQTLGESPLGSGYGKAVRQAAWQFLVRPPRVDGKAQVGAWVRIRIDYTMRMIGTDGPGN